jgi:hypothetical protein
MIADNVIQFRAKIPKLNQKIKITHMKNSPYFETTPGENFAIKRFLTFALQDVQFQVAELKKSRISKQRLEESEYASGFIMEYLKILLQEIDLAIKSVEVQ